MRAGRQVERLRLRFGLSQASREDSRASLLTFGGLLGRVWTYQVSVLGRSLWLQPELSTCSCEGCKGRREQARKGIAEQKLDLEI